MPKLRLYPFFLTITDIVDTYDKRGVRCLKVKGFHSYNANKADGTPYTAFDNFNAIIMYGTRKLLDETVNRFEETRDKKLIIEVLDADIINILKQGYIVSTLLVYYYDFKIHRFGTRKLIKKRQAELTKSSEEENEE